MTDATLPQLCSSSLTSEARPPHSSSSNSSDTDVFPFVVHSQHAVTNGDPPEVDNGKLARQKRRRTSAEDQATLEAEYKRNPKPDKAARMEIVKRVSLGEKEVQIWFQNRRQNTRRKSRPLLPHEIAAFGLGGITVLSSDPARATPPVEDQVVSQPLSSTDTDSSDKCGEQGDLLNYHSKVSLQNSVLSSAVETGENEAVNVDPSRSKTIHIKSPPDVKLPAEIIRIESSTSTQTLEQSHSLAATLGYLSNRRNALISSLSTATSSQTSNSATASSSMGLPSSSCPELSKTDTSTQSSKVRLSLSLDGKAELVSADISPLRPQRPRPLSFCSTMGPRPPGGLQRSHSALPISSVSHNSSSILPPLARIPSGRSRDARTWEFCCDTEARDELTTQAENESSGSAVAAISLLRSTSNTTLKSNVNKRNAPAPKTKPSNQVKKPKLGRTSSSLARLQYTSKDLAASPSGDSDKENWFPVVGSSNAQRRIAASGRSQKQNRRRVLEDSSAGPMQASVFGDNISKGKFVPSEVGIFADHENCKGTNQEVENFMRGEVSPSKKGDLDCIQGLLSLSQGTWR